MTPEQVLKSDLLDGIAEWSDVLDGPFDTQEKIDAAFVKLEEHDFDEVVSDAEWELRRSYTHETGIECEWSRHYESKSVAKQFGDKWVGWTYWYGGGKHGEPDMIDWMENAYFVDAREETTVVLVFSKQEAD